MKNWTSNYLEKFILRAHNVCGSKIRLMSSKIDILKELGWSIEAQKKIEFEIDIIKFDLDFKTNGRFIFAYCDKIRKEKKFAKIYRHKNSWKIDIAEEYEYEDFDSADWNF